MKTFLERSAEEPFSLPGQFQKRTSYKEGGRKKK